MNMEQLTTRNTWYAVSHIKIGQDYTATDMIILSRNQNMVQEFADVLSKQRGYPYEGLTATDVYKQAPRYVGEKLFVTDSLKLSNRAVKRLEKQGVRILGQHRFGLSA